MTFSTSREVEMVSTYCFNFMYFVERMDEYKYKNLWF